MQILSEIWMQLNNKCNSEQINLTKPGAGEIQQSLSELNHD